MSMANDYDTGDEKKEYDNEKRGVLFKNNKREKDSQPHYKGNLQVNGVEYWMSAWVQESKKGSKYMSVSIQAKDEAHKMGMEKVQETMQPTAGGPVEDDIPFAPYMKGTVV